MRRRNAAVTQPDPPPAAEGQPSEAGKGVEPTAARVALEATAGLLMGGGPFAAGAIAGELAGQSKQQASSAQEPEQPTVPTDDR